jgi:hypothetical protein
MVVEQSIFKSTKGMLDIASGDTSFDSQVLGFINSALADLVDFGAGPPAGLFITGDTENWNSLSESPAQTERIKNWLYLKVRLFWDPPQTSFLLEAHTKQIDEAAWRIINGKDSDRYLASHPEYLDGDDVLLGGGPP